MKFGRGTASRRALAMLSCCTLVVAACGSDDDGGGDAATTSAASVAIDDVRRARRPPAVTTPSRPARSRTPPKPPPRSRTRPSRATPSRTPPSPTRPTSDGSTPAGSAGCPEIDDSLDEAGGTGAGRLLSDLECAAASPLAAEGEPIIIGLQNPEGDPPAASRSSRRPPPPPSSTSTTSSAAGARTSRTACPAGRSSWRSARPPSRPDDSQRCANELVSKEPFLIASSINFFGNHLPIFEAAGIPAVVMSPVTIADFTAAGRLRHRRWRRLPRRPHRHGRVRHHRVRADEGRRPVGRHAARAWSASTTSRPSRWTCSTARSPGDAERAGSMPDLEYLGVPIKPATPDVTPQVTRDPRLRARRDHVLRPGRRLLEPRRRARPPRVDARQHPARALRGVHRLRGDARRRRRWPRASTSSARATR